MTLLAALTEPKGAYLVSDILQTKISEAIKHVPHAIFPVENVMTHEYWRSVIQPMQKAYIINDRLCVGVAGNSFTAKDMVIEIYDRFHKSVLAPQ